MRGFSEESASRGKSCNVTSNHSCFQEVITIPRVAFDGKYQVRGVFLLQPDHFSKQ